MGIGQSIKKGFSIAQSSWNLVAVLFGFGFIWNLISMGLSSRVPDQGEPDPFTAVLMAVAGVLFILLSIFFQAGSLGYVKEKIKSAAAGLQSFSESGRKYYFPILAVAAVVTLIIGVFALLAAFLAGALPENMAAFSALLAIVAAALGLSFVVLLFLAPYIIVAENAKPGAAIRQSMTLVKKHIGAILGVSLALIAIAFGVGAVLGAVFTGINLLVKGVVSNVIVAFLSSFVNAYLGVVVTAAFMALYLSMPKGSEAPNTN